MSNKDKNSVTLPGVDDKRYLEIVQNIETVKPENEAEKRLIAQIKKIKEKRGVAELPE